MSFSGPEKGHWIPISMTGSLGDFEAACRNIPKTPAFIRQAFAQQLLCLAQSSVGPVPCPPRVKVDPGVWPLLCWLGKGMVPALLNGFGKEAGEKTRHQQHSLVNSSLLSFVLCHRLCFCSQL